MLRLSEISKENVRNCFSTEYILIDNFIDNEKGRWVQTSYNTYGGVHKLGGTPLRKNFAGVGYTYDSMKDAFIPPKPFNSWTLNETTCLWEAPVARPEDDNRYTWNETNQTWDLVSE